VCARIHLHLHLPGIYADAYTDSYSAAKSNTYCHTYCLSNCYSYTCFDSETFTDAQAASHSTAAPVAFVVATGLWPGPRRPTLSQLQDGPQDRGYSG
jgi:hypothetical protein